MKVSKYKKLALLTLTAICTALSVGLFGLFHYLGGILRSQQAAEEFRGTNEQLFAQVSAYFPVGEGITEENIYSFHQTLEQRYLDASISEPEKGSLYTYAYSASGTITVEGEKGSAQVKAIGIGGDFFTFHPLFLRSGGYIKGSDLMHDAVVLDEELAWRLFGGMDLAGMKVMIGGSPYVIAGVISREDDFASRRAYTDGASLFMAYDKLNALTESEISCYELVSADPIKGFALSAVKQYFGKALTVENSERFTIPGIWSVIKSFGTRSMNTAAVIYPYWENAARFIEDLMALVMIPAFLLLIVPVIALIMAIRKAGKAAAKGFRVGLPALADKVSERRYYAKQVAAGNKPMLDSLPDAPELPEVENTPEEPESDISETPDEPELITTESEN